MEFRDLKKQYQALKPQIDAAMQTICANATFIGGAPVKELEEQLAADVGRKHCITCANGTDALQLAEMAYGIESGDAVFVPDFTFFSTAETVASLGATPIFVDVDEETFNMDPKKLEQAICRVKQEGKLKAKAIVAVDLFGLPADFETIEQIAKREGLVVVEDGAQGFGGMLNGKRACSFGDIATTSFFPAKPLGGYGDGGAIFTDDDEIAALLRSLCVHGKNGQDKYDNIRLGMNSRLDSLQAAILKIKLDAFAKTELDAVNQAAAWYNEALAGIDAALPVVPKGFYSSWAQYTLRFETKEKRDAAQAALKAAGIPSMIYYGRAMHQQGVFSDMPYSGTCPVTERLCQTVLSLPMHPYLQHEDVLSVAKVLKEINK
ncbi:MAG: DegT/DnrJ/EryC1/StrS aminotransferase family protein [Oscillospiraceae bacterium]|nr:DegT/DnrJ/EryC1/StrS aminotransferase family protein [Oscillospiraceae bacterium]